MSWFYPTYWNDEKGFLQFLRRKLPIISGGGGVTSLTTTGTSGASTLVAGVLNVPIYGGAVTSLTTVGTSGAATLVAGVLNIPVYATATPGIDSVLAVGQTLTANRTISGNHFTLTLDQAPLISTDTSASSIAGGYYILKSTPIKPLETHQTNFNITRSTTAFVGDGDEVVNIGFNVAPNATPETASKGAMFWSMESGYRPSSPTISLWEWHQEFVNTAGTNWRISSYTINNAEAATPDIDYYLTASRFYIKDTSGGSWFTVGDTASGLAAWTLSGSAGWTTTWQMNGSGLEIKDSGGSGAGRFMYLKDFLGYAIGNSGQIIVVDGAQTQINTYGSIPVNIRGAGNTNFYIFGGASNGTLVCTDLPAGNYTMVINLVSSLTTGYAAFEASANNGYTAYLFQTGSAYATSGAVVASMGVLNSTGTGGLFVGCTGGGPIIFCPAANVEQARFDTNGKFVFVGSSTTRAVMNLGVGSAPTSPVDGDVWREDNTNTGIKARVNGVTKTVTLS